MNTKDTLDPDMDNSYNHGNTEETEEPVMLEYVGLTNPAKKEVSKLKQVKNATLFFGKWEDKDAFYTEEVDYIYKGKVYTCLRYRSKDSSSEFNTRMWFFKDSAKEQEYDKEKGYIYNYIPVKVLRDMLEKEKVALYNLKGAF
jgi:hypothetical protein